MVYKSATWILGVASNGIYNIFWQIKVITENLSEVKVFVNLSEVPVYIYWTSIKIRRERLSQSKYSYCGLPASY